MKMFKGLFIDQGIIKAGEFPVEPDSCFLPFCETDGTDIEYCKCHELETEYERAMRDAKANAVECENPQQARKLILFYNSKEVLNSACLADMKDGIYPLPSGWDYRVEIVPCEKCSRDCYNFQMRDCKDRKVAKLYHTDPLQQLTEQQEDIDPEISTIVEKRFMDMVGSQEQPEPEEADQRDNWRRVESYINWQYQEFNVDELMKHFTITRRK